MRPLPRLLTAVALLGLAVIAVADPSRAAPLGSAVAIAWPAGGHPVIATVTDAVFCDDDRCADRVVRTGGPGVTDGYGVAAISPDGSAVIRAALSGGPENGGPFIDVARCTRAGCRETWVPVRASAAEPYVWPELTAGVAADRSIWFGLTAPESATRLLRCPDITCAAPERSHTGGNPVLTGSWDGSELRAAGADGRVLVVEDDRPVLRSRQTGVRRVLGA